MAWAYILDRPPQSPDLNLDENFCDVLEKALHSGHTVSSLQDLGEEIKVIFCKFPKIERDRKRI